MPLMKGEKAKTKKGMSQNIKTEMEAGKPKNQAIAIAFNQAKKMRKKKK